MRIKGKNLMAKSSRNRRRNITNKMRRKKGKGSRKRATRPNSTKKGEQATKPKKMLQSNASLKSGNPKQCTKLAPKPMTNSSNYAGKTCSRMTVKGRTRTLAKVSPSTTMPRSRGPKNRTLMKIRSCPEITELPKLSARDFGTEAKGGA